MPPRKRTPQGSPPPVDTASNPQTASTPDPESASNPDAPGNDTLDDVLTPTALPPASTQRGGPGHDLAAAAARRVAAVRDKINGLTYEQIAERHGYADKASARRSVLSALDRVEQDDVAGLRVIENARIDLDERTLNTVIVANLESDPAVAIRAIDSKTRLRARRARLNGLDAPQQINVTGSLRAEAEDALAELAMLLTPDADGVYTAQEEQA